MSNISMLRPIKKRELEELERGIKQAEGDSHVEYAILDRAGRLQVPATLLESIGVKDTNKVKLELVEGKIVLTSPEEAS